MKQRKWSFTLTASHDLLHAPSPQNQDSSDSLYIYICLYIYIYTVFTIELVPNINKPSTGVLLGPQVKHVLPVVLQKWYV